MGMAMSMNIPGREGVGEGGSTLQLAPYQQGPSQGESSSAWERELITRRAEGVDLSTRVEPTVLLWGGGGRWVWGLLWYLRSSQLHLPRHPSSQCQEITGQYPTEREGVPCGMSVSSDLRFCFPHDVLQQCQL